MESPIQMMAKIVSDNMKKGEESFIEMIQSEMHRCEKMLNNSVIFFVTPEGKLKCVQNEHHVFHPPISIEVECCMWCGFKPTNVNNSDDKD